MKYLLFMTLWMHSTVGFSFELPHEKSKQKNILSGVFLGSDELLLNSLSVRVPIIKDKFALTYNYHSPEISNNRHSASVSYYFDSIHKEGWSIKYTHLTHQKYFKSYPSADYKWMYDNGIVFMSGISISMGNAYTLPIPTFGIGYQFE